MLANQSNMSQFKCHSFVPLDSNKLISVTSLLFIMIFVVLSNATMIFGLWKVTVQFQLFHLLIFMQSCIGILIGAVALPIRIVVINYGKSSTCFLIGLQAFMTVYLNLQFDLNLLVIAYTRFRKLTGSGNKKELSRSACAKLVLFTFFYSVAAGAIDTLESQVDRKLLQSSFFLFLSSTCLFSVSAILYIDLHLIKFLHESASCNILDRGRNNRYDVTATRIILIMSLVLVMCFCPTAIVWIVAGVSGFANFELKYSYEVIAQWTCLPILLDAGLNAVIYIVFTKKIKSFYADLMFNRKRVCENKVVTDDFQSFYRRQNNGQSKD